MKIYRRNKNRKGFSLLAVLMVVTLFIMAVLCALVFWVAERSVSNFSDFIIKSKQQETESVAESIANDADVLSAQMYSALSDIMLTRLRLHYESNLWNYSYLEYSAMLNKQLSSIENALNFTETLEVYLTDYRRVITSDSIMRYDDKKEEWLRTVERHGNGLCMEEGELVYSIFKETNDTLSRQNIAIVSHLSGAGMMHYLQKFAPNKEEGIIAAYVRAESGTQYFAASTYNVPASVRTMIADVIAEEDSGRYQYVQDGVYYLLTWKQADSLPIILCQITPMNMLTAQMREYRRTIVLVFALIVPVLLGMVVFLYYGIFRPIQRMKQGIQRVAEGNLHVRIPPTWSREFQEIFGQFNAMAEKLQYFINQEYKLKLLNAQAELKQLQHQITPHFLYNTYFNLRAMLMEEEYDQAMQMADLVGRYLRYVTTSTRDEVPLREEYEHSVAYLQIMKLRFGSRLETRVQDCPPEAKEYSVPRISIQPLIENAFEHGIRNQVEKGIISVNILPEGDVLRVQVDDNGANADDVRIAELQKKLHSGESTGESVALFNIQRRITMLYPAGSGLYVSRSPLGGFRSEIRIVGVKNFVPYDDCR